MTKLSILTALIGALSVTALPHLEVRDIRGALPQNADPIELRFQPYMDFDGDSCYQTSAVDPAGHLNPGAPLKGAVNGHCRDPAQLENANTYSRRRCNSGHCAIIYEMYYEKDMVVAGSGAFGGHVNDWENVVVIARMHDNVVVQVSYSEHSGYAVKGQGGFELIDGTHPTCVYHKDGGRTHTHRPGKPGEKPENVRKEWFRAPLVGYFGYPNKLREFLYQANFGSATLKQTDARFVEALKNAGAGKFLNINGPDELDPK